MELSPKEKAEELVEKYKDYVSGYVGSSMLTNTEYPEQILRNAIQCAIIDVKGKIELVDSLRKPEETTFCVEGKYLDGYEMRDYCEEVLTHLNDMVK